MSLNTGTGAGLDASGRTIGDLRCCPFCAGERWLYSPLWRAYLDRCQGVYRAWRERVGPGWEWSEEHSESVECQRLRAQRPPEDEPEERDCETCETAGVGDLVADAVGELVEAASRAERYLVAWRGSGHADLEASGHAIRALSQAVAAARVAGEKLHLESDRVALIQRLSHQRGNRW